MEGIKEENCFSGVNVKPIYRGGGWLLPKRVDSVFEGGSYPQCTLWVRRGDGGF